jgi:hypothetical protein
VRKSLHAIAPFNPWPRGWWHDPKWNMTAHQLRSRYGDEVATEIVVGSHAPTNEDIRRWRALGQR